MVAPILLLLLLQFRRTLLQQFDDQVRRADGRQKGYALSVAAEVLSAALTGSPIALDSHCHRLVGGDKRVGAFEDPNGVIGCGGMGVIYKARQRNSQRIVALKRILSVHVDSRDTLARFQREAVTVASLRGDFQFLHKTQVLTVYGRHV